MKISHFPFNLRLIGSLFVVILGPPLLAEVSETNGNGIIDYKLEPNPQEIEPKMFNWEIMLNAADSTNGTYQIIQISKPLNENARAGETKTKVLIDQDMDREPTIARDRRGLIHFMLHIGDKEPTQNMNGPGQIGLPIIFSGKGTGKAQSSWIVLPGRRLDHVAPSGKGTQMSGGQLRLIQFTVVNTGGEKFQTEVILRRK